MNERTQHSRPETVAFLALLLIPLGLSAAFAQRDSSDPPLTVHADRPALVFSNYLAASGSEPIDDAPIVTEVFQFLNKSDRDVRITDIEPSCGCLSPQITSREIAPGQAGQITLPIRTANESPGPHEYLVVVKYEDPEPRQVTLTWKVVLPEKQVRIEPRVLIVLGTVKADQSYAVTVSDFRTQPPGSRMRITGVRTSSPKFTAVVADETMDGVTPQTRIEVCFQPPFPAGRHRGMILLETDDDTFPILEVPVLFGGALASTEAEPLFSPESPRVIVDETNHAASEGTVVSFRVPVDWVVSHCDVFPSELAATLEAEGAPSEGRKMQPVTLSVSSRPATGVTRGILTLHATHGDESEMITVPVSLIRRR